MQDLCAGDWGTLLWGILTFTSISGDKYLSLIRDWALFHSGEIIHKKYLYGSAALLPATTVFMVQFYFSFFFGRGRMRVNPSQSDLFCLIIRSFLCPTFHSFGCCIVHILIGAPCRCALHSILMHHIVWFICSNKNFDDFSRTICWFDPRLDITFLKFHSCNFVNRILPLASSIEHEVAVG